MSGKSEYTLNGLCCANCAAVIEDRINKLEWVKEARVNLATQILYLDGGSPDGSTGSLLQELVDTVEEGVTVQERSETSGTTDDKGEGLFSPAALLRKWTEIIGALIFFTLIALNRFGNGTGVEGMPFTILYAAAYLLIGRTVLLSGLKNMKKGRFLDENFLMIIATAGAFAIGDYPEAVAVMLFYQVGEFFQDIAVDRSRRSIRNLMDSKPGKVMVLSPAASAGPVETEPEDVPVGTLYRLRPGDRVPLDGVIEKGEGTVDSSALTGESYPRQVSPGSTVLSGFVNRESLLEIRSTKTLSESSYSRIIRMVEESSSRKARSEQFITRFAAWYTPAVVALAALLAVIPPLVIEGALFSDWIYRALVFLVVSCPCALVVSIPLGFFAGIGRASKEGILVKGGNYLEALNRIDTVFMDKTGTLTEGKFSVSSVLPAENVSEEELLKLAAVAESSSSHPIAESIVRAWRESSGRTGGGSAPAELPAAEKVEEIAGHGIRAHWQGDIITIGKASWMEEHELNLIAGPEGSTTVHVALGEVYKGAVVLSDAVRRDTPEALKGLKKSGIGSIIMLTGDSDTTARVVADQLGLDGYQADLLPHQKVEALEMSIAQGRNTAFMGDGINDAPVLARADVGIAMGGLGSDAAIEAADIVLMADEPSRLVNARRIARKTREIVVQNIIMALGIKAVILVLAALGYAGMGLAVFGDVGVALLAVLNVLRIMSDRGSSAPSVPATHR